MCCRVAHAVRALGQSESPLRQRELIEALAYWASRYETLPDARVASAGLLPSEALQHVEQLPVGDRARWMLFTQPIAKLSTLPSFPGAADLVDVHANASELLSDLTETFAALLATNVAEVQPRALAHTLTGGSATRLMLPYLSPETTAESLRYGWKLAAAFYAALVLEPPVDAVEPPVSQSMS